MSSALDVQGNYNWGIHRYLGSFKLNGLFCCKFGILKELFSNELDIEVDKQYLILNSNNLYDSVNDKANDIWSEDSFLYYDKLSLSNLNDEKLIIIKFEKGKLIFPDYTEYNNKINELNNNLLELIEQLDQLKHDNAPEGSLILVENQIIKIRKQLGTFLSCLILHPSDKSDNLAILRKLDLIGADLSLMPTESEIEYQSEHFYVLHYRGDYSDARTSDSPPTNTSTEEINSLIKTSSNRIMVGGFIRTSDSETYQSYSYSDYLCSVDNRDEYVKNHFEEIILFYGTIPYDQHVYWDSAGFNRTSLSVLNIFKGSDANFDRDNDFSELDTFINEKQQMLSKLKNKVLTILEERKNSTLCNTYNDRIKVDWLLNRIDTDYRILENFRIRDVNDYRCEFDVTYFSRVRNENGTNVYYKVAGLTWGYHYKYSEAYLVGRCTDRFVGYQTAKEKSDLGQARDYTKMVSFLNDHEQSRKAKDIDEVRSRLVPGNFYLVKNQSKYCNGVNKFGEIKESLPGPALDSPMSLTNGVIVSDIEDFVGSMDVRDFTVEIPQYTGFDFTEPSFRKSKKIWIDISKKTSYKLAIPGFHGDRITYPYYRDKKEPFLIQESYNTRVEDIVDGSLVMCNDLADVQALQVIINTFSKKESKLDNLLYSLSKRYLDAISKKIVLYLIKRKSETLYKLAVWCMNHEKDIKNLSKISELTEFLNKLDSLVSENPILMVIEVRKLALKEDTFIKTGSFINVKKIPYELNLINSILCLSIKELNNSDVISRFLSLNVSRVILKQIIS